ncbi:MAG TPA: hypothetical protein VGN44_20255 [Candidatus Angelobacter sp.]
MTEVLAQQGPVRQELVREMPKVVYEAGLEAAPSNLRATAGRKIVKILDALFGCWHKQISFPQTSKPGQRRIKAALQTGTYVVCLDCGTELAYDWKNMRVLSPNEKPAFAHPQVTHAQVEVEAAVTART